MQLDSGKFSGFCALQGQQVVVKFGMMGPLPKIPTSCQILHKMSHISRFFT